MAFPINPLELFKVWKEGKQSDKQQFIKWLEAVQAELKRFLGIWQRIDEKVEVLDARTDDAMELLYELAQTFRVQRPLFLYIEQFYESASVAANGRFKQTILDQFILLTGTVLNTRMGAIKQVDGLVVRGNKSVLAANPDNQSAEIQTVHDIIAVLEREIVTLDVFIETVKANPGSFR